MPSVGGGDQDFIGLEGEDLSVEGIGGFGCIVGSCCMLCELSLEFITAGRSGWDFRMPGDVPDFWPIAVLGDEVEEESEESLDGDSDEGFDDESDEDSEESVESAAESAESGAVLQLPLGGDVFVESISTSGPGSGNIKSFPSTVPQSFPTLATNILGLLLIECVLPRFFLLPPSLTLMTAQFIYISRFPT